MIYALLVAVIAAVTVIGLLALGAIAVRLSMLDRERLRRAGAPALLAFTPGGGAQSAYELLLGSVHRRVGDAVLSAAVWTLRTCVVLEIVAWFATFAAS
jgi:hypothetical protein